MKIISVLTLAVLVLSCSSKKDPEPIQILINTDVENGVVTPSGWWSNSSGTNFTISWSTDQASSPSHSLKIIAAGADATNFGFWAQTYSGAIPTGKDVILTAKVKTTLVGDGISLAIRGDDTTSPTGSGEQFITTQGVTSITGTSDWRTFQVKLTSVQTTIKSLTIYLLLLPNTTGTVYFDDATLTYQ